MAVDPITQSSPLPSYEALINYPERLNLLFSPFRTRALNPEHYEQKLKFWIRSIEEYVTGYGRITFSILDLQEAFRTEDGKRPTCLVEVVNHMLRENIIVPKEDWITGSSVPVSWVSWSISSVKWVFTKALSYSPVAVTYTKREIDPETQFVHLSQLRTQSEKIYGMTSLQNKVMGSQDWKQIAATTLRLEDIDIVLEHLKSNGRLCQTRISQFLVVKMPYPKESSRPEITAAEKSQYDIARTIQVIDADVTQLASEQEQYEKSARQALKEGKRTTAKHHLRLKKIAEKRAVKLNEVLDNLYSISTQIEDSASDVLVVSAYEAGKKALAKQLKDNNLNTNRVTETMLDLQEVFEDYNHVSASISLPILGDDVSELDEELAMLLEEDKASLVIPPIVTPSTDPTEDVLRQLDDVDMEELEPLPFKNPARTMVVNKGIDKVALEDPTNSH